MTATDKVKRFSSLDNLIEEVKKDQQSHDILLCRLSRLVEAQSYMTKASHEGRYIEVESSESLEDRNYLRHQNGVNNYKIALTHASLNKKPVREVHGGCTPEEILVPFIVISNKKENIKNISTDIVKQNTPKETPPKQTEGFKEEELF